MRAINLKTNHLTAPVGIDAGPLFLSWQCADGVRQTAYEIQLTANGEMLWHSGKTEDAAMHADVPAVVGSRVSGCWRVRLWDENDVPGAWSEARFETGLAQCDWVGEWVDPETEPIDIPGDDAINAFARPNWERKQAEKEAAGKGAAESYKPHRPASYLRKSFMASKGEARLYITAKGLYAAWLDGKRIGDMVLAPGSFTGNKHLSAQTYDVTALLHEGENELLIALGDGWHRSTGGVDGDRDLFGDTLGVLFQLEVDGKPVCVSDDTMQATQCGPIRQNDMQQGEVYNAQLEGELTGWHGVRTYRDDLPITGMNTVPILEHEAFPGKLLQTPNGEIHAKLEAHGIHDGIVADLGCGTGELTLMLTQAGYDMIGIDQSEEMLCVVRDKAEQLGLSGGLLLLRQDLLKLDLYGTIRGAVSTFDTFNHIPDLDTAIANAGFFMEKGGVFLFDMNTPYKHQNVLGENEFTFEEEDASCVWRNHYNAADRKVEITVDIDYHETAEHFHEQFYEYTYDLDTIRTALEKHGFALESVCDGETFGPLTEESQRYFFCAVKQYTQLEG